MATQGPPRLSAETPLAATDNGNSNVAVNQKTAEQLRAANVDGKDIYPQRVFTKDLSLETSLTIGSGVQITDGSIISPMVATNSINSTHILALDLTASDVKFASGSLSELGVTTLGTITGGSLAIGAGGCTIGSASAGIGIQANKITCIKTGVATVTIDGDSGIITASKFQMTADADSTLDMSLGSLTIGAGASVGGTTTIGDIATNATAGAAKATTFAQTSVPTALAAGDLWCDTDDGNKLYRAAAAGANEVKAGEWVAVQDTAYTSRNKTFAQTSAPTATATGDMWIDTDDGNKLYRWNGSSWVSVQDAGAAAGSTAIQTGGYVTVDANKNITNISTAGITIGTATSGARVQLNSTGVGVYNSAGTLKTTLSTDGLCVYNTSGDSYAANEALSFMNSTTPEGVIYYNHSTKQMSVRSLAANGIVNIDAYNVYMGYDTMWAVYNGSDGFFYADSDGKVNIGHADSTGHTLEVWNTVSVRGTGACVQVGGGPALYANAGSPNGSITAYKGSICMDYTNGKLYVNTNGGTTWVVAGAQT